MSVRNASAWLKVSTEMERVAVLSVLSGMDMNAASMKKGGIILAAAHVVTSGYYLFASIVYSESNLAFASVQKVTFFAALACVRRAVIARFSNQMNLECHERGAAVLSLSTAVEGVLNRRYVALHSVSITLASNLTKVCSGTQMCSLAWLVW
jgi:hypothetical protein